MRRSTITSNPVCPICHGRGLEEPPSCTLCEGKGRIQKQQMGTIRNIARQAAEIQKHKPGAVLNSYQRAALSLFPEYQQGTKSDVGENKPKEIKG